MNKTFADYKNEGPDWITLATGEFYPDILPKACRLYSPYIENFGKKLQSSSNSIELFLKISKEKNPKVRVQLARIFKKYVSPTTPVEMLKRKRDAEKICKDFGHQFRDIEEVKKRFLKRPVPDEALCAVLWEYKDRGKKGYKLTTDFFEEFELLFPDLKITGPKGAGKDIRMGDIFNDYPKPDRPVDFIIWKDKTPLAIGFARYDSDRGGAQEDDRTGGYRDVVNEILQYAENRAIDLKVIFLNDGPGLLLGSMWDDYAYIEDIAPGKILVITLKMLEERLSLNWLISDLKTSSRAVILSQK